MANYSLTQRKSWSYREENPQWNGHHGVMAYKYACLWNYMRILSPARMTIGLLFKKNFALQISQIWINDLLPSKKLPGFFIFFCFSCNFQRPIILAVVKIYLKTLVCILALVFFPYNTSTSECSCSPTVCNNQYFMWKTHYIAIFMRSWKK